MHTQIQEQVIMSSSLDQITNQSRSVLSSTGLFGLNPAPYIIPTPLPKNGGHRSITAPCLLALYRNDPGN